MKYIFANLKRFDIPINYDGINSIAPVPIWGGYIAGKINDILKNINKELEVAVFFPEAQIGSALQGKGKNDTWKLGCQGVYRMDTQKKGNFGAFTTNKTAKSMKALGCEYTIIGHCEERMDKAGILEKANVHRPDVVNDILNEEIKCAERAGMKVLYCVGENADEQDRWEEVIGQQLEMGLEGVDLDNIVIGYEPLWAIGPGKPVPDAAYIRKIAKFIKAKTQDCPVLYGGGLKEDNARMIADIEEVDGGLVGLTQFSGDIGFYPEGFERIILKYLGE